MKSNFSIVDFVNLKNENIEYIHTTAMLSAYETIEKALIKKMDILKHAKTQKEKELVSAKTTVEIPKELTNEDFQYLKNIYHAAGFNKIEYLKEKIVDKNKTIQSSLIKFSDEMYVETPAKNYFYYKYFISLS